MNSGRSRVGTTMDTTGSVAGARAEVLVSDTRSTLHRVPMLADDVRQESMLFENRSGRGDGGERDSRPLGDTEKRVAAVREVEDPEHRQLGIGDRRAAECPVQPARTE